MRRIPPVSFYLSSPNTTPYGLRALGKRPMRQVKKGNKMGITEDDSLRSVIERLTEGRDFTGVLTCVCPWGERTVFVYKLDHMRVIRCPSLGTWRFCWKIRDKCPYVADNKAR